MKLGNNFTNPVTLIDQLYANGADAVVLFNRLYQPDIDIDRLTIGSTDVMSQPGRTSLPPALDRYSFRCRTPTRLRHIRRRTQREMPR